MMFSRLLLLFSLSLPAVQAQPTYLEGLRLKSEGRPNFILIVAESLGHGDLGCYGQPRTRTPNIDRLAQEGVRFTHYYTGSPLPARSRISMLTGADSRTPAQRPGDPAVLTTSRSSLAMLLQTAGYVTGAIGTWGLGDVGSPTTPNQAGFREWFGYLNPATSPKAGELWRNELRFTPAPDASGNQSQDPHELIVRAALNFIRVNRHRPFFLYFSPPTGPRSPVANPPAGDEPTRAVAALDDSVGEVLRVLQETGLDQETFVFFTSDGGPRIPEGASAAEIERARPFRGGMGQLLEGGLRVPMLVRATGRIPAGAVNQVVCASWDLLPTIAELAKTRSEIHPNQISLVPAIHGHLQTNLHEHLYWELPGASPQQAVRMARWKAIRLERAQPLLLYDLQTDPAETNNLASRHPDISAKLRAILDAQPEPGSTSAAGPPTARPDKPPQTSPSPR